MSKTNNNRENERRKRKKEKIQNPTHDKSRK